MRRSVLLMLAVLGFAFAAPMRVAGGDQWISRVPDPRPAGSDGQYVLPGPARDMEDTVEIYYDDGTHRTWWCSDKDSFGVAVRFTPTAWPCYVVGTRAEVGYDEGQQVFLRVFDATGDSGLPGAVLYEQQRLDIPPGQNPGFRDYDLTAPVTIDSGDFYICFWQKHWFHLLFGSDQALNYVDRQWWFFPAQGWVPPSGMDAADHLVRAKVTYSTGIEAELSGAGSIGFAVSPNPVRGNFANVRYIVPPGVRAGITVSDAAGRVLHSSFDIRNSSFRLDLRSMPAGLYLVRLCAGGLTATRKLVVQK
jgi:hypothetical protein